MTNALAPLWRPDELPTELYGTTRYLFLSRAALPDAIRKYALLRAGWRYLRYTQSVVAVTDPERAVVNTALAMESLPHADIARRLQQEIDLLKTLVPAMGEDQAITAWLQAPIEEMWLPPMPAWPTRARFDNEVAARRAQMDIYRLGRDEISSVWRAHCPAWKFGMSGERANAFDYALDTHRTRVQAFFDEHGHTYNLIE